MNLLPVTAVAVLIILASKGTQADDWKNFAPKPTNVTCYTCADDLHPDAPKIQRRCSEFRSYWRKFIIARKGVGRSDYRDELLNIMRTKFGIPCTYGTEDCFYSRPVDIRIVGYEQRGCGSGPREIDAEPGEGCVTEMLTYGGEKVPIMNCVCEDKESTKKGYCNKGTMKGKGSNLKIMELIIVLLLLRVL